MHSLLRPPTAFLALLATLLSAAPSASARVVSTVSLHLAPTQILPQPQLLPPSTHARLTRSNATLTAPLRRNSRFIFPDVPAGSYLADVWSHDYLFVPMRVDVAASGAVEIWQTFRGNEWSNTGEKLAAAGAPVLEEKEKEGGRDGSGEDRLVVAEAIVGVLAQRDFYEKRQGFNPMSLLKNPMILIGVAALAMMFGMPKLLENMDPEMREEFEKQQSSGPFAALSGGMASGNPAPNFDMAAWMAGSDKKDQAKSSGTENAPAKRRR